MTTPESDPVRLDFEVTEYERRPGDGRTLTITSVLRDGHAIRINYEIAPPLTGARFGPWGEAEDDLANRYNDSGGAFGPDDRRNRTDGVLSLPLPVEAARELLVRIEWVFGDAWDGGAQQLRIDLAHASDVS
jgi:hypothetical protein